MTETEWNDCTEPQTMLDWLRTTGRGSERKLRLFAVASARRMMHLTWDEWNLNALTRAEQHADGAVTQENLRLVFEHMQDEFWCLERGQTPVYEAADPDAYTAACRTADAAVYYLSLGEGSLSPIPSRQHEERSRLCGLLRCIFGNPFRAVSLAPAVLTWQGGTIPRLAAAASEDRAPPDARLQPARLAVLADALEEAGCDDKEILVHLRSPGPHARGCFALDAILGNDP